MATVGGCEVDTTECDKERAAREVKEGAFTAFLAWLDGKGWKFCALAGDGMLYPTSESIVAKFVPYPPDGGSQEIGDFIEECEGAGLVICEHHESNWDEVRADVLKTEEGRRRSREACWSPSQEMSFRRKGWYPLYNRVEDLLAAYFGIDLNAASRERDAILAAYREMHKEQSA